MSTTPTGLLSKPLDYLRHTVAASTTFQTWTSSADEAAALAHVYPVEVVPSGADEPARIAALTAALPFAVVDWMPGARRVKIGGGSRNYFQTEGDLGLLFRAAISASDAGDAAYDFLNKIGAIISEMEVKAGLPGYLDVSAFVVEEGPHRPEEKEAKVLGEYYEMLLRVAWEDQA